MDGRVRGVLLGFVVFWASCQAYALDYSSVTEIVNNPIFEDVSQVTINHGADVTFNSTVTITAPSTYPGQGGLWLSSIKNSEGSTATFNDAVVVQNGTIGLYNGSTAFFNSTVDAKDISINGNSNATFVDTVRVVEGLEIMDGAAVTEFQSTVTAGCLAIDTIRGAGFSTNTFKDDVTLNSYDSDIFGTKQYSLIVAAGTNTFEKNVTTGNKSAAFLNAEITFNGHINAGTGDVELGWSPMTELQSENEPGFSHDFYTDRPGLVILSSKNGSTPTITANNVSIYETGILQVDSDATINASDFSVYENGSVLLNNNATLTTSAINVRDKGVLDVQSDATINGNIAFATGGVFSIDARNQLTVSGTATIANGALANIRNAGSLDAIGKTIMTASAIDGKFDPYAASLYKVATEGTSVVITGLNKVEDVLKEVNVSTANSAAAAAMTTQVLADASATPKLQENLANAIQDITALAATNPHLAKVATMQLFGENTLAAATATQTTAESFSTGISSHQIQLRDQAGAAGATTGSDIGYASINPRYYRHNDTANRIWAAGFGAWTKQRNRGTQEGYKYDAGGFILGYDREFGDFVFGVSGAYSNGDIKNNEGFTKTDIETLNVGLYGSYNPACGLFVDVNAGFGFAWNDMNASNGAGGVTKGKYRNTSFQMGGNIGYTFNFANNIRFVPTVGLQYTHIHQEAYQQTVSDPGMTARFFDKSNSDFVSIPVAVRLNKSFDLGNGIRITPELRAAYIFEAKKHQPEVRMGYVGASATTTLYGMDSGRSRGLVGFGVKAKLTRNLDVFADYNFAFRKKYTSHNVMAGLGLSF